MIARALLLSVGCLMLSAVLMAKGETTKIVIAGPDATELIVITDKAVLDKFGVWTGPGTGGSVRGVAWKATSGFVFENIEEANDRPSGLTRYKVSFHVTFGNSDEPRTYVVFYEYDQKTDRGFVYVPASDDPNWRANVRLIHRGIEGRWVHAASEWKNTVKPLLQ